MLFSFANSGLVGVSVWHYLSLPRYSGFEGKKEFVEATEKQAPCCLPSNHASVSGRSHEI